MTRALLDEILDPTRLSALDETGLLDHLPVASLDRYTRIAAHALGVPVALVSLVDDRRQFFVSQVGLPEPWSITRETPLSHSFCKHVVADRAPLVVEDSRTHPVVRDNPSVWDLSVVAYAGLPIETGDRHVIGSFCAIDGKPRAWSGRDLAILRDLADAVGEEADLRRRLARAEGDAPSGKQTR
ncbi:MAG: GAF domain-containing protein [Myxococcales bacterium]|nr:MAG: GAF domain-containing protein [Myxococcales bacterium]